MIIILNEPILINVNIFDESLLRCSFVLKSEFFGLFFKQTTGGAIHQFHLLSIRKNIPLKFWVLGYELSEFYTN